MNARVRIGLLVPLLTACGSAAPSSNLSSGPCPIVIPKAAMLVYPAPGATGLPDGNFTVVLAGPTATLAAITVDGRIRLAPAPLPRRLPSPHLTPQPDRLAAYAVGQLAPHTTYAIVESDEGGSPCVTHQTAGRFTTR